jgi:hypothetical protein
VKEIIRIGMDTSKNVFQLHGVTNGCQLATNCLEERVWMSRQRCQAAQIYTVT